MGSLSPVLFESTVRKICRRYVGGNEIELTARERELLMLFVSWRGNRKFGPEMGTRLKTVRGAGYRLS